MDEMTSQEFQFLCHDNGGERFEKLNDSEALSQLKK